MKKEIQYTLLSDGSSDRTLLPILDWVLKENTDDNTIIQPQWANLYYIYQKLKKLEDKITYSLKLYPCNILFVHRDSERKYEDSFVLRKTEINNAWDRSNKNKDVEIVAVIPVRMTEAWLLIDELAIRKASGNPTGRTIINLPKIKKLENLPDPKSDLENFLLIASGFKGRNLDKLKRDIKQAKQLVAQNIKDFAPLRNLRAFQHLEKSLQNVLKEMKFVS